MWEACKRKDARRSSLLEGANCTLSFLALTKTQVESIKKVYRHFRRKYIVIKIVNMIYNYEITGEESHNINN